MSTAGPGPKALLRCRTMGEAHPSMALLLCRLRTAVNQTCLSRGGGKLGGARGDGWAPGGDEGSAWPGRGMESSAELSRPKGYWMVMHKSSGQGEKERTLSSPDSGHYRKSGSEPWLVSIASLRSEELR